jgi:hypothetical protein
MTYPEFIVQEYLNDTYKVSLDQPKNEDESKPWFINKLGPFVKVSVQVEVVDIYSRSAKLHLTFEGIHRQDIFYMSSHKSPDQLSGEIYKKIDKIVNKALIEEGREEWIRAEFAKSRERLNVSLQTIVGKIKEIDEKHDSQNYLQD